MMRIESTPPTIPDLTGQKTDARDRVQASQADRVDLSIPDRMQAVGGDVRPDRIAQVRERLENGFYNRPEIREGIAEAFLNTLIPGNTAL